jgi:hypothetical protein
MLLKQAVLNGFTRMKIKMVFFAVVEVLFFAKTCVSLLAILVPDGAQSYIQTYSFFSAT